MDKKKELASRFQTMTIRRSLFILIWQILFLEIALGGINFVIRFLQRDMNFFVEESGYVFPQIFFILRGIEIILTFYFIFRWLRWQYHITPSKIIYRKGVLSSHEEVCALRNVESIELQQTFFQKIFRYGDLKLFAPTLNKQILMRDVSFPKKKLKLIESLLPKTDKKGDPDEEVEEVVVIQD